MPWLNLTDTAVVAVCAVVAWRGWPSIRNCRHCKLTEEQCDTKLEELTDTLNSVQSELEDTEDALNEITEQHEQLEVENENLRKQILELTSKLETKDFTHV
jgi:septal ring factor EnvC (AmiA/AmiB activator)